MKQNIGAADRIVRITVAIILGGIFISGKVSGILAALIAVFAIMLLLTSVVGWCPLYSPLGISTRRSR